MALLGSTILYGQSNTGSFHTIGEHNRVFVNNAENKTQEDVSDSICFTDSITIDSVHVSNTTFSELSIKQLEKLIKLYESYKQDKRERSTLIKQNNQQILRYYNQSIICRKRNGYWKKRNNFCFHGNRKVQK